jgi:Transglutaminase-like superfamily
VRLSFIGFLIVSAVAVSADEAVYLMRGPILPLPHSVNGYAVDVRDRADGGVEVHVETSLNPIGSRGSFAEVEAGEGPVVPRGFNVPASLRSTLRPEMDAWEAATTVLEWVSDNLALVDGDHFPQDAASVLKRRGGRCSGLANATAALLMATGFEARTVSGLLITGREAIPHRWVECRLPGAGWVPTDPTLGWWIVTPRHVAFDRAVDRVPSIEMVAPAVGELHRLPRVGTTLMRPNLGAELVCRLTDMTDDRRAIAWLSRGSDQRQAVLGSEVRFASLLPGRWLLEVELEGKIVERREFDLRSGVVHSYVVRLPSVEREEVGS